MLADIGSGLVGDQTKELRAASPIGQGARDRFGDLGVAGFLARFAEGGESFGQILDSGAFLPVFASIDPVVQTQHADKPFVNARRIDRTVQPDPKDTLKTARGFREAKAQKIQNQFRLDKKGYLPRLRFFRIQARAERAPTSRSRQLLQSHGTVSPNPSLLTQP